MGIKAKIKAKWDKNEILVGDEDARARPLQTLERLIETPILPGSIWIHAKGGRYRVISLATLEADLTSVVCYQTLNPDTRQDIWVRPVSEFWDRFVPFPGPESEDKS